MIETTRISGGSDSKPVLIFVTIPTFRRIGLLSKLLQGIAKQDLDLAPSSIRVIVLDNDAARSAEPTVAAMREGFPFQLEYASVPEPGLASVRNFALDLARHRCDFLAMIDDDECPEPQWLRELLSMQRTTRAEAVVGPVPPILNQTVPRWVHDYRARELPVYPDGVFLSDGWSGNCLLDMRAIVTLGVGFDRKFNFAGGEDQLFFRQLVARGGRIAYAARAVAWEDMPPHRLTVNFVLKRSFRRGNTLALCDRRIYGRPRATITRTAKAFATLVRGFVKVAFATQRRDCGGAIDAACDGMSALGMLCGLFGVTYQAYRRPMESVAHVS